MLYFAYGADVRARAMAELLGHAVEGRRARLRGFRLAFTARADEWGGGVANIVRDEEAEVEGVVFELAPEDAMRLDFQVGLSEGLLRRRRVRVEAEDGKEEEAVAYEAARKRAHAPPSPAYLDAMVSGATEQGLSEAYVNWLMELYPDAATPRARAWTDEE